MNQGHSGYMWVLTNHDTAVCFHTGHCVLHACTSQRSRLSLSLTVGTAVARVNALVRLCDSSVPATGGERHCFATVAVAQPLSASSARLRETQWPGSRRSLSVPSESSCNSEWPTSLSNRPTNSMLQGLSGEAGCSVCGT